MIRILFLEYVVQFLSLVRLFVTPWTAACQDSLYFIISRILLKLISIQMVMPSSQLILCCSLLFLPSIFPSIRVFSNELAFLKRWPKYLSFSFSINIQYSAFNIQGSFPLGLTGLISLLCKGFSRVFSSTTVQKRQFFSTLPFLLFSSHIHTWLVGRP